MKQKVKLYSKLTGEYYGKRVVYNGVVNEFGDRDEYYLDRRGNKVLLAQKGLEVAPRERDKIIRI